MSDGLARRLPAPLLVLATALVFVGSLWAYRTVAQLDPEFFRPTRLGVRALVAYLTGDLALAGRTYRESARHGVTTTYPEDPSGIDAVAAGDLELGARRARTTLALLPGAVEPRITLGEIALERGEFAEALTILEDALRRRPDDADALYLSVIALVQRGRHADAVDRLNRVLMREGVATRPLTLWRVMQLAGELAARPVGQRPLSLLALLHRYLRIFDPHQASTVVAYATAAIEAGDRPADAWVSIGIVRAKLRDAAGAAAAMERALALDPRHADVAAWLAGDAQIRRDLVTEYRMTRTAFESRPADPYVLDLVDDLVGRRLGDPRTHAELMTRAIQADPESIEAHAGLAEATARLGDAERAAAERAIVERLELARRAREDE